MERRDIRMDGDTSSVICSFRLQLDVRVGVYDQLTVNVLCISELHYCKSIVDILQALCFLLTLTVKWLYYGLVTSTMSVQQELIHVRNVQSADCMLRSLSFRSPKVDAIVTNIPGAQSQRLIHFNSQ